MAKKEERTEDLNPRSKELDEKVRQMMDPAVPDPPTTTKKAVSKTAKINQVDVHEPIDNEPEAQTAPELDATVPLPAKGRKVIVPVHHDESEEPAENLPAPEPEPEERPPLKIDVDGKDESKEEVAEKLDEAIAGLSDKEPETKQPLEKTDEKSEEPETEDDEADEDLPKPAVVEEPETDKAVKDIVSKEGDELLEVEDAIKDSEEEQAVEKKHKFSLKKLFASKKTRKILLILFVLGLVGSIAYPTTRYGALNLAGIRSSSTVVVIDSSTQQPLKNVTISLGNSQAKTDAKGSARLEKLRLGKTKLTIERVAFAKLEKTVTLGWGSNPLGNIGITPTGAQYKFEITDVLSAKAVAFAEAETDEFNARGDEKGVITLTVPQTELSEVSVRISAQNYRTETLTLNLSNKDTTKAKLTPGRKHVFISKRSGKYDIYGVYVDGKDEKVILAGSGNEKEDLTLLPHPTKNSTAYVSTRAGKKNSDGFVLSDLVLLDATSGRTTPIATAERIQLVGWIEDRLVFVAVTSGESAATATRNRLLSYNLADYKTTELAKSNYFNDLLIAKGLVYFAPSSAYAGGTPAQFYRVKADGSEQKSLLAQEVWNILRTTYDKFALSVGQQWFEYKQGETSAKKLDAAPASKTGRVYIDSPDTKKSAWVDQRDGKGTLIIYDVTSKEDKVLVSRSGLSQPLVWLDTKTLVFRVESKDEVADYAVSIDGGQAVKIRDVTKTAGIDNWYYH